MSPGGTWVPWRVVAVVLDVLGQRDYRNRSHGRVVAHCYFARRRLSPSPRQHLHQNQRRRIRRMHRHLPLEHR